MRLESVVPEMDSQSRLKALDDDAPMPLDADDVALLPTETPPPARLTGKRASRDEPVDRLGASRVLDLAKVSSLGRELMERKRMLLSQVALSSSVLRGDGDVASLARLEDVKVSDEDSDSGKSGKKAKTNASDVKTEPLSEEDIQRRKAQRRREQVRAASRRCRDRQRRETEELRMKVFQLEEFISHTMQTYESELRRQKHQMELIQRENENLRTRLTERSTASTTSSVSSPASVSSGYGIKMEHGSPGGWVDTTPRNDDIIWDIARIQNMHKTTEDCKRAMLAILNTPSPPAFSRQAFGWNFDFWAEGSQYFVKTRKFFRGMRAHEVADRNFDVDFVKYIETFPEVKEKKVHQWPSPNVKIVQTVKDFPGRGPVSSLSANFISRDDLYTGRGERWICGVISVGTANALKFSPEDDCNGYIFQDAVEVASDGSEIHGCLALGVGRYEGNDSDTNVLMEELAKVFASVVIRWEGLFINDYMVEADETVNDIDGIDELDF